MSQHKHDFKRFPELTNSQMATHYWDSPHKQLVEPFSARVTKVSDGDTIRVTMDERNFDFPIRLADLAAPELDETGGRESQRWLSGELINFEVDIFPTKQRVEKWGRLLAHVMKGGIDVSEDSVRNGHGVSWAERGNQGGIDDIEEEKFDPTS